MKKREEYIEEMKNKKIEISEYEFSDVLSRVIAKNKHIETLTSANPVLMLAFTAFGIELSKELFDKKND